MTMTRLPMGCNGGMVGVAAPLKSFPKYDEDQATYLGGSARAAVVLAAPPVQDAAVYTPAATLGTGVGDVEDGHPVLAADVSASVDAAALSRRRKWATRGLTLFGNLWDVLMPVRDWLAELVSPKSLESALVLAGAQAHDLSVPVALQMSLTNPVVAEPAQESSGPNKSLKPSLTPSQENEPTVQKKDRPWWVYYRPSPHR